MHRLHGDRLGDADDEDDPVVASAPGVVSRAERWTTSYGHWVRIDHPSGEYTIYAHMNAVTVAVGQTVDQGTQVGTVGNTGNSFGAHLHFEIWVGGWFSGGAPVDPLPFLQAWAA